MTLGEVTEETAEHLDAIRAFFKPGVKISIFVRTPGHPTRDFVLTDDDLAEVVVMISRSRYAKRTEPETKPREAGVGSWTGF